MTFARLSDKPHRCINLSGERPWNELTNSMSDCGRIRLTPFCGSICNNWPIKMAALPERTTYWILCLFTLDHNGDRLPWMYSRTAVGNVSSSRWCFVKFSRTRNDPRWTFCWNRRWSDCQHVRSIPPDVISISNTAASEKLNFPFKIV